MKNSKHIIKGLFVFIFTVTLFNCAINEVLASSDLYVNYYGIEMTENEYNNLYNLGFTEHEIYYMDERTFIDNKDEDEAELLATNTKYYKTVVPYYGVSYTTEVTYEEFLNHNFGNDLLDYSATYYQEFYSTISYKNATKYRYKINTNWLNLPSNYSFDVMGIGFLDDVYISSNLYFRQIWTNPDSTEGQSTGVYDSKSTAIGGSVTFQLPNNAIGMTSTLYYDVSKETNDTITSLSMCGDYAHSIVTVTGSQASNYVMSYYGIGFDASVGPYFDAVPCTYGGISGINW
jgi:hypothetical protein